MNAYKFPDEVEKAEEEKLEIEIEGEPEIEVVDDTPAHDRGRKPMKDAPSDITDDELSQYSESVKKRIQHFSKGYHEERRAKEAALREREEAVRLAQTLVEENKKLQGSVGHNQQILLEQAKKVVAGELEQAKQKYKQAYESGDSDALVSAQEELTSAKIKSEKVNNFKPAVAQSTNNVVQPVSQTAEPAPQVDHKARAWQESNPWFGSNKEMTALALAVHQDLVESGLSTTSDEYYDAINNRMRKRFPEAFSSGRRSQVVSPATRSTAPRKIVLTQSQVQIAKRLGLTNEQYARAVAEEMRKQNG
jgi:hypothetical protein